MSKSILLECLKHDCVTGTEPFSSFSHFLKESIARIGGSYQTNANGDILGCFGDIHSPHTTVLEAHMDEVGFFINTIQNEEIWVACIGKYNFSNLEGVNGATVFKVHSSIQATGTLAYQGNGYFHLITETPDLFATGDILAFRRSIIDGREYISAPSLDNKVGCALLLSVAQNIVHQLSDSGHGLILVFSTGEEIRQNSSAHFLDRQGLDIGRVIVVDAAYAQPVVTEGLHMNIPESGKGPALQYTGETFIIPADRIRYIENIAQEHEIPLQKELAIIDLGRTNQLFFYRQGWDVSIINIPVAYQHSIRSRLCISDYLAGVKLVSRIIEEEISQ